MWQSIETKTGKVLDSNVSELFVEREKVQTFLFFSDMLVKKKKQLPTMQQ